MLLFRFPLRFLFKFLFKFLFVFIFLFRFLFQIEYKIKLCAFIYIPDPSNTFTSIPPLVYTRFSRFLQFNPSFIFSIFYIPIFSQAEYLPLYRHQTIASLLSSFSLLCSPFLFSSLLFCSVLFFHFYCLLCPSFIFVITLFTVFIFINSIFL